MPPRDLSTAGADAIVVEAYLAQDRDDPGLQDWKRDHPDWIEAGTWTAPARPAPPSRPVRAMVPGGGRKRPPLDAETLSVADFQAVRAAADITPVPGPPDPDAPA